MEQKEIKQQNKKCPCGSGRRYKICCKNNIYQHDNPDKSQTIIVYIDWLKNEFPNHTVIDITHTLEPSNYKNFQCNNYEKKSILIANRTPKNDKIFVDNKSQNGEAIVLFFGAYVCFEHIKFDKAKRLIDIMINGKSQIKCYRCKGKLHATSCCELCENDYCLKCIRDIATIDNIDFTITGFVSDCVDCPGIRTIKFYNNIKN